MNESIKQRLDKVKDKSVERYNFVKVIHCKDCKYRAKGLPYCYYFGKTDFCSKGERKERKNMTKIISIITICIILFGLTSCNISDTIPTHNYDRAIIKMPDNEVITIDIEKCYQINDCYTTIISSDGKRYLVNPINCILIDEDYYIYAEREETND